MVEISTTITVGEGSEKHNHNIEYRATLEHVSERENGVIELVPYEKTYHEQIDELMKPFIDEYNEGVRLRYAQAWERYNNGEIKTKPRKRDFKEMEYNYSEKHKEDYIINPITKKQEKIPLFRSMIIGLGDKSDRENGRITEAQARRVLEKTLKKMKKDFPYMNILGCSMHCDEVGFYHAHLDYKFIAPTPEATKGLKCSVSQDKALDLMGYKPEQSIINATDKAPIRFNAMRNRIYKIIEEGLADEGLRLMYHATKTKEPEKDSSKNQSLENWQELQDRTQELQHEKNVALDIIESDTVSPEALKELLKTTSNIERNLAEVEASPRSRLNKDNVLVPFKLFDQLQSFIKDLVQTVGHLINQVAHYRERSEDLEIRLERSELELATAERERQKAQEQYYKSARERATLENAAKHFKAESERKDSFMQQFNLGDHNLLEEYEKQRNQGREHERSR